MAQTNIDLSDLSRPADEVIREHAWRLVERADRKADHLERCDGDPEALHDFRVALRRLRSFLRAQRHPAGIKHSQVKTIGALASETGAARDAEVALALIAKLQPDYPPQALVDLLTAERDIGYAVFEAELPARWHALSAQLKEAIQPRPADAASPTYGEQLAGHLKAQLNRLRRASGPKLPADPKVGHRTRIVTKQLRYLLEPVAGVLAEAALAVETLKGLQDTLGEMHDRDVLLERVHLQATRCKKKERDALDRLSALAAALAADRVRLAARLARHADEGRMGELIRQIKGARKRLKHP